MKLQNELIASQTQTKYDNTSFSNKNRCLTSNSIFYSKASIESEFNPSPIKHEATEKLEKEIILMKAKEKSFIATQRMLEEKIKIIESKF